MRPSDLHRSYSGKTIDVVESKLKTVAYYLLKAQTIRDNIELATISRRDSPRITYTPC
jgi:hypothetical protein